MTTLLKDTIETDASRSSATEAASTAAPAAGVRLGRRLNDPSLPAPLGALRTAAKKLIWTAVEARQVDTPWRYARRELLSGGVGEYALRGSGVRFAVRHRSGDIDIFRKFYGYRYYEWPAAVRARLTSLRRPINTLDLGGNIGFFEVHTREQLPVGRAVAYEPDAANGRVWQRARELNAADWQLVPACAGNANDVVRFHSGAKNFSRIGADGDVTVPAHDVFPAIAQADLVKMNIEGSEWEILEDPRLRETDQVWIVEYHRIRNPRPDITAHVRELFERAGYRTELAVCHEDNGLVWAWRDTAR